MLQQVGKTAVYTPQCDTVQHNKTQSTLKNILLTRQRQFFYKELLNLNRLCYTSDAFNASASCIQRVKVCWCKIKDCMCNKHNIPSYIVACRAAATGPASSETDLVDIGASLNAPETCRVSEWRTGRYSRSRTAFKG